MDIKIGEVQPLAAEPWLTPEFTKKEFQVIPPIQKTGGSVSAKIGNSKDRSASGKSAKDLKDAASKVQDYLSDMNISLDFHVEDKTGELVVKVVNRDTGDVIRQIPPEALVKLRQKLEELRGVLFDGKV